MGWQRMEQIFGVIELAVQKVCPSNSCCTAKVVIALDCLIPSTNNTRHLERRIFGAALATFAYFSASFITYTQRLPLAFFFVTKFNCFLLFLTAHPIVTMLLFLPLLATCQCTRIHTAHTQLHAVAVQCRCCIYSQALQVDTLGKGVLNFKRHI